MSRSTAKALTLLSTLVFVIIMIIAALNNAKAVIIVSGILWLILNFILSHFARCRHCGRWPGRGEFFAEYCSRCGEPLDD